MKKLLALILFWPLLVYGQTIPISALPAASTPLAYSELIPCVQAAVTKKCTPLNILAGNAATATLAATATVANALASTPAQCNAQQLSQGITATGASNCIAFYPITTAETAGSVTPVNFFLPAGYVLRYQVNTVPGTTNMQPGFQAAANQLIKGGSCIYATAGQYLLTTTVTVPINTGFCMKGDGPGVTTVAKSGDTDAFTITTQGSSADQILIQNMSINTPTAMSTGDGFNITCSAQLPSVTVRDVVLQSGGGHFLSYINTTNCGEQVYDRVFVYGDSSGTTNGIDINSLAYTLTFTTTLSGGATSGTLTGNWAQYTGAFNVTFSNGNVRVANLTAGSTAVSWTTGLSTTATSATTNPGGSATVVKFLASSIYNVTSGLVFNNNTTPGIEGVELVNVDIVGTQTGVLYQNSQVPTYFPPQLTWIGGHNNSSLRNFDLTGMSQVFIHGGLFYNSGGAEFIRLVNSSDYSIIGNQFEELGTGNVSGIGISASIGPLNGGVISDNLMRLAGSSSHGVYLSSASNIQNLAIHNLQRIGGLDTLSVLTGTLTASTTIQNSTPDTQDIFDTSITAAAGANSLLGTRATYFLLGTPGGAVTVTTLTSRGPNDDVYLGSASGLITLQNNGTNPDGFALHAGANYVFGGGSAIQTWIHLKKLNGGYWTEVGRD